METTQSIDLMSISDLADKYGAGARQAIRGAPSFPKLVKATRAFIKSLYARPENACRSD